MTQYDMSQTDSPHATLKSPANRSCMFTLVFILHSKKPIDSEGHHIFLTIKHLKTPKSFIPQRIQNHFSCFAPSGGSVFPLNSSTCSTANSPFVSVPVLSKPAERIKGLGCASDSSNDRIIDSSVMIHSFCIVICLKQPKFNVLLVVFQISLCVSWRSGSFHWPVNGPSKIVRAR